jgi:hypothetical protein
MFFERREYVLVDVKSATWFFECIYVGGVMMRNEHQPLYSEGICTDVSKEPDYQLTTCSTCTVEGKCGRKMGGTSGPNLGLRASVTHSSEFLSFYLFHLIFTYFVS